VGIIQRLASQPALLRPGRAHSATSAFFRAHLGAVSGCAQPILASAHGKKAPEEKGMNFSFY